MLTELLNLPKSVNQALIDGDRVTPLIRTMDDVDRIAKNESGEWILGLYKRFNPAGRNEAGIFYGYGPNCQDPETFPCEMLRFFSGREECYTVALSHFEELVDEYHLEYLAIAKDIKP